MIQAMHGSRAALGRRWADGALLSCQWLAFALTADR